MQTEKCPNCGAINQEGITFCAGCGINIDKFSEYYPEDSESQTLVNIDGEDKRFHKKKLSRGHFAILLLVLLLLGAISLVLYHFNQIRLEKEKAAESYFLAAQQALTLPDYQRAIDQLELARAGGYDGRAIDNTMQDIKTELAKTAIAEGRVSMGLEYALACLGHDRLNVECNRLKCDAAYLKAEQEGNSAKFEQAIQTVDSYYVDCYNRAEMDILVNLLYQRWYDSVNNMITRKEAVKIYQLWKVRFPD